MSQTSETYTQRVPVTASGVGTLERYFGDSMVIFFEA